MLTKPMVCPGGRLHLNAKTRGNGFIRVAVLEGKGVRDGEPQDGWGFEDAAPFTGDSINHVARWQHGQPLGAVPDRILRLHFWMEKAQLYSFWFE